MGVFDKKTQAEAQILEDEGAGRSLEKDFHGVDWTHHTYILEVRPAGEDSFRVEAKTKVAELHAPRAGDVVTVAYDPKSRKAEIKIEGDPRYDPKLRRANIKQERGAHADALLSGAPLPPVPGSAHHADDEPRWIVPAACPECGARVDQSRASMAKHPKCAYCAQPLPCEPVS